MGKKEKRKKLFSLAFRLPLGYNTRMKNTNNVMWEVIVTAATDLRWTFPYNLGCQMGERWTRKGEVLEEACTRHYFKDRALARAEDLKACGVRERYLFEFGAHEIKVKVRKVAR